MVGAPRCQATPAADAVAWLMSKGALLGGPWWQMTALARLVGELCSRGICSSSSSETQVGVVFRAKHVIEPGAPVAAVAVAGV